jgi:hypothetical protein
MPLAEKGGFSFRPNQVTADQRGAARPSLDGAHGWGYGMGTPVTGTPA